MKTAIIPFMLLATLPLFAQHQSLSTALTPEKSIYATNTRTAAFPNLAKYLSDNLQYTPLAQKNGVEGLVIVEALIDEEGVVSSVGLTKGIGFGCDEAVMELVSNMPAWIPALQNGKRVAQKVFIRAQFRLE